MCSKGKKKALHMQSLVINVVARKGIEPPTLRI